MKARLLAGAVTIAPPPIPAAEPEAIEPPKKTKPVPMIGTMKKSATPEQRAAFAKMKRDMKRAARNVRYDQHLQEKKARDKQ